jgi:thioredoxin-dependent peroxiredoxin
MKTALLVVLLAALAQDKPAVDLKVGDAAPKFEAPDDTGKAWKSEDHVGKKALVVYFFPAAFTGG